MRENWEVQRDFLNANLGQIGGVVVNQDSAKPQYAYLAPAHIVDDVTGRIVADVAYTSPSPVEAVAKLFQQVTNLEPGTHIRRRLLNDNIVIDLKTLQIKPWISLANK